MSTLITPNDYKPLVAIIGPSGSGKSTSLRNLPVETTEIIDLEMKGLPFKQAKKFKTTYCSNMAEYDTSFKAAIANPRNLNGVVVVESFTKYTEHAVKVANQASNGDGYKTYAMVERLQLSFLEKIKNKNCIVVVTGIDEIVKIPNTDGTETAVRRMATKGRAMEGRVEKEFLLVLFTQVVKNKDGKMEYFFQTNTDGITCAKTPMSMFDNQLIQNDINLVITELNKYYEENPVTASTPNPATK